MILALGEDMTSSTCEEIGLCLYLRSIGTVFHDPLQIVKATRNHYTLRDANSLLDRMTLSCHRCPRYTEVEVLTLQDFRTAYNTESYDTDVSRDDKNPYFC